jgi:hypothetical protein
MCLSRSLELCTLGAKCALAIKDMSSVAILCDSVARYAVTFEDSLEASFITMTSLIHSKISDSVAYAISTLIKLGVSIPQLPSRELILQQMDGTQLMLNAMSGKSTAAANVSSIHVYVAWLVDSGIDC